MLAGLALTAALPAACGGSSGAPAAGGSSASPAASLPATVSPAPASPAPSASPAPRPLPQITAGPPPAGAVAVTRWYWELVGAHQYDAAFGLTTGPHVWRGDETTHGVRSARYIRPSRTVQPSPGPDATVAFGSTVVIVPSAGSPFGTQPRRWLMFSRVVRMSDGTWRLVELGTGP